MRINDHQLIHRVDPNYVLLDEPSGAEITLTPSALARITIGARYFADHDVHLADAIERAKDARCPAGLVLAGAYYRCEEPAPHDGGPHRNAVADAVWGEPT